MVINHNIKTIRKLLNLTQIEFAGRIGISLATLKNYENTNVSPKLAAVLAISEIAGVSPEYLRSAEITPKSIETYAKRDTNRSRLRVADVELPDTGNMWQGDSGLEDPIKELKVLRSNDAFFKHQYAAFNAQVLANLSALLNQSRQLEALAKSNLTITQKIERRQTGKRTTCLSRPCPKPELK